MKFEWHDYQLGYDDGKQDKAEGQPDALWFAIPTPTYTLDKSYWVGYGDGWFGSLNKHEINERMSKNE